MTLRRLAWMLVLLAGGPVAAQPPMPPVAAPAADPKLENVLLKWEQEMSKIQTLQANLARTEKDTTFNTTKKYIGFAQYMKAKLGNDIVNCATLDMRLEDKPN